MENLLNQIFKDIFKKDFNKKWIDSYRSEIKDTLKSDNTTTNGSNSLIVANCVIYILKLIDNWERVSVDDDDEEDFDKSEKNLVEVTDYLLSKSNIRDSIDTQLTLIEHFANSSNNSKWLYYKGMCLETLADKLKGLSKDFNKDNYDKIFKLMETKLSKSSIDDAEYLKKVNLAWKEYYKNCFDVIKSQYLDLLPFIRHLYE